MPEPRASDKAPELTESEKTVKSLKTECDELFVNFAEHIEHTEQEKLLGSGLFQVLVFEFPHGSFRVARPHPLERIPEHFSDFTVTWEAGDSMRHYALNPNNTVNAHSLNAPPEIPVEMSLGFAQRLNKRGDVVSDPNGPSGEET